VTISITPENGFNGPCWPSLNGGQSVPIKIRKKVPAFNIESENSSFSNDALDQRIVQPSTYNFQKMKMELFPNPAKGIVTIKYDTFLPENARIEIVNMFGNSVANQSISAYSNAYPLDISNLTNGTYETKPDKAQNKPQSNFLSVLCQFDIW